MDSFPGEPRADGTGAREQLEALQVAATDAGELDTDELVANLCALVASGDQLDLPELRQARRALRSLSRRDLDPYLQVVIDGTGVHLQRLQRRLEASMARAAEELRMKSLKEAVRHLLSIKPATPDGIARALDITDTDARRAIDELREGNEVVLRRGAEHDGADLDGHWVLHLGTPEYHSHDLDQVLAEHPDIESVWIQTTRWFVPLRSPAALARLTGR